MILRTEDITKRFGGLVAVDHVTLDIEEGEIFGIIGPNGAGKTTLINLITGFYDANEGSVEFKGEDITNLNPHERCHRGLVRTFQIVNPFPSMSVLDNVKVAAMFGGGEFEGDYDRKAMELLDFIGFEISPQTPAAQLNTNQKKYLELARALATDCDLIILDELAAGLTPGELPELINLLREIRDRGITVVIIEHVMRLIMEICERIAVLHYGEKIAQGSRDEIANSEKVIEAYLGEEYGVENAKSG